MSKRRGSTSSSAKVRTNFKNHKENHSLSSHWNFKWNASEDLLSGFVHAGGARII